MMILLLILCLPFASPYRWLPSNKSALLHQKSRVSNYRAKVTDVPYHALIAYDGLYCSGAVISSKIVVTAASCLSHRTNTSRIMIKVDSASIIEHGQVIPVQEVKMHEYFRRLGKADNDIALLLLVNDVNFTERVSKAIVIESDVSIREMTYLQVSGFSSMSHVPGTTMTTKEAVNKLFHSGSKNFNNVLVWSSMQVIHSHTCMETYKINLTPTSYCATYDPAYRLSDNGGPAIYQDYLVGIVSSGANRKAAPYFAVITNVSYFSRWLELNSRRLLSRYCRPSNMDQGSDVVNTDDYD